MSAQPIGGTRVKIVKALPVERVASSFIEMQVTVRNASRHFLAHPTWREDVVLATDDKAWTLDILQLIQRVVLSTGSSLSLHGMKRLRRFSIGSITTAIKDALIGVVIVPERLGEDEQLYILHKLFRTKTCLDRLHVSKDGLRIAIATCPGTHEDSTLHFLRGDVAPVAER